MALQFLQKDYCGVQFHCLKSTEYLLGCLLIIIHLCNCFDEGNDDDDDLVGRDGDDDDDDDDDDLILVYETFRSESRYSQTKGILNLIVYSLLMYFNQLILC